MSDLFNDYGYSPIMDSEYMAAQNAKNLMWRISLDKEQRKSPGAKLNGAKVKHCGEDERKG